MSEKSDEMTDREKEFEFFGMGIEEIENMLKKRVELQNVPATEVLIDWLELAQEQLEPKYKNVNHLINRVKYILTSGLVVVNLDKK